METTFGWKQVIFSCTTNWQFEENLSALTKTSIYLRDTLLLHLQMAKYAKDQLLRFVFS